MPELTASALVETTGGCLCGAVRYRVTGPIAPGAFCHCSLCRRASGAPVVAWLTVAADAFVFSQGQPRRYRSSPHGRRGFCATCGTPLTFESEHAPHLIDITVASLDDAEGQAPDHHVYWPDRLPWLALADDFPRYATDTPPAVLAALGLPAGAAGTKRAAEDGKDEDGKDGGDQRD